MRFDLRSPRARIAFAAAVLLVAVSYTWLAARHFRAWSAAERLDEQSLRRAVDLLPANAEFHNRLGRYLFNASFDVEGGIEQLRAATSLNPYFARYWLDLADAYLVGDKQGALEEAVGRALIAEPTNPDVALRAANHYLVAGDVESALPHFRVVIANHNPQVARSVIEVCWRATRNAELILDRALPPSVDAHTILLNILVDQDETAAAQRVWKRVLQLKQEVLPRPAFRFIDHLVEHRQIDAAQQAWHDWIRAMPDMGAYAAGSNLVVNGGFELPALNGGLEWRHSAPAGITLSMDSGQFHGGVQALAIEFQDFQGYDAGLSQLIPVKPGTGYDFAAYRKGDTILTTSGPRLALSDHYTGNVLMLTEDLLGTTPWRQDRVEFTTGPDTRLLRLRVLRTSTARPVRGRMWVDDVVLTEKQP